PEGAAAVLLGDDDFPVARQGRGVGGARRTGEHQHNGGAHGTCDSDHDRFLSRRRGRSPADTLQLIYGRRRGTQVEGEAPRGHVTRGRMAFDPPYEAATEEYRTLTRSPTGGRAPRAGATS